VCCVICKQPVEGEWFQVGPHQVMCRRCIENRSGVSMNQFINGPWFGAPDYEVLKGLKGPDGGGEINVKINFIEKEWSSILDKLSEE